jgi:hypothetical protein
MSKKNFINTSRIEGYLYEHNLKERVTGPNSKNPGQKYISGDISIATDDDMLNVVKVYFTYVVEFYAPKNPGEAPRQNANYPILNNILNGTIKTVMSDGKENAAKFRIDSALALNEWYDARNGNALVSVMRNEGGFIHATSELNSESSRATFEEDMIITNFSRTEATDTQPEKGVIKGAIIGYGNRLLPVSFSVLNPQAMNYFEGLEPTQKSPVFTKLRGQQISKTVVREITEESAWGEPVVKQVRSTQKDFVITWAQPEPYIWDDESTLTANDLNEMIAAREIHLAELKKSSDERQAANGGAFSVAAPAKGEYKF